MKTLVLAIALCLPACAQFRFFHALSTWKGTNAPYVGPFDSYTATQGLWDINVRLLSSYTGNLITVRRSSDSATNSFTYVSATGKLDTNAILAWSGASSVYVTTVYDQSGGGRNFSQSDTTLQPLLINAGTFYAINGEPSMQKTSLGMRLYADITGSITNWNLITVGRLTDATPVAGTLFVVGDNSALVDHTVIGPSAVSAPDYDFWVYNLGETPALLGTTNSYPYPHTYSVSVNNATTNLVFKADTLATSTANAAITVSWTKATWLDGITSLSNAAKWISGSMAFFTSIPSDQTTIMRYYTNRFATTYIP